MLDSVIVRSERAGTSWKRRREETGKEGVMKERGETVKEGMMKEGRDRERGDDEGEERQGKRG